MPDGRFIEQALPARVPAYSPVHYPDCDGQPLAVNDTHYFAINSIRDPLPSRYQQRDDVYVVYVTGDLLLYYKEHDNTQSVAPDVMVVLGVANRRRKTYLLWEEGKPPDVVVEVSSPGSFRQDRTEKRELYGKLGVREYFLYVPDYDDMDGSGRMFAFRRWGKGLVEADPEREIGGEPEYASEVLGVGFRAEDYRGRLRDLKTGLDLPWPEESEEARKAEANARRIAEQEREQERQARQLVEERLARLQARLRDEE